MRPELQGLWQQVESFSLDDSESSFKFSQRLAKENNWSPDFTRRVLDEYKRFAFLAKVAGHSVSPSDAVDQAWHLHLTYTRSYWDDFCGRVLEMRLHHEPTKGGPAERGKHFDWYRRTLATYREVFETDAPTDIWPTAALNYSRDTLYQRIDRNRYWLLPRVIGVRAPRSRWLAYASAPIPFIVLAAWNPLDFVGPTFLLFYVIVALVTYGLAWGIRFWLYRECDALEKDNRPPNRDELAYLNGGTPLVAAAAVATLAEQDLIVRDGSKWTPTATIACGKLSAVSVAALESLRLDSRAKNIVGAIQTQVDEIDCRLMDRGLLRSWWQSFFGSVIPFTLMALVMGLGVGKLVIGVQRGKPITFLIVALVATLLISGISFLRFRRLTKKGQAALARGRDLFPQPLLVGPPGTNETNWGTAVALYGIPCLAVSPFVGLQAELDPLGQQASGWRKHNGGESSGCSTGCSSGGGCGGGGCGGGGCGGGGCGGCGG